MAEVEKLTNEPEKKLCDVCSRNLIIDEKGTSYSGMELRFSLDVADVDKVDIFPYKINKQYRICYPCLLSKLGVKP